MNLYEIQFTHYGCKNSESGIKEYIIAQSEEEVFNYIDKTHAYDAWTDREDEWGNEEQTYKEFILENKGDDNDESLFEDLFYGKTTYGWKALKENLTIEQVNDLIKTDIVKMIITIKGETNDN